jgi:hypothetical protein
MTVSTDTLTKGLIKAAHKFASYRRGYVKASGNRISVLRNKKIASMELFEAEAQLAEADVQYALARLKVVQLLQQLRQLAPESGKWGSLTEAARQNLWRIAATGSQAQVVAAAQRFGEASRTLAQFRQQQVIREATLGTLQTAEGARQETFSQRENALQKRNDLQKKWQAAVDDYNAVYNQQTVAELLALERNLVTSAAQFTDTESIQALYNCSSLEQLGLAAEGLDSPSPLGPFDDDSIDWSDAYPNPPRN